MNKIYIEINHFTSKGKQIQNIMMAPHAFPYATKSSFI